MTNAKGELYFVVRSLPVYCLANDMNEVLDHFHNRDFHNNVGKKNDFKILKVIFHLSKIHFVRSLQPMWMAVA